MENLAFVREYSLGFVEQSPSLFVSYLRILEIYVLLTFLALAFCDTLLHICRVGVEFSFEFAEFA
jgi:hypothetical protein